MGRDDWQGMDRFEARKKVVATLDALGLVNKIEDNTHMVPFGDRSDMVIEPWLTDQWYVDAATLAKPAREAVEDGRTKFVPANWDKTYFEWMNNIQPGAFAPTLVGASDTGMVWARWRNIRGRHSGSGGRKSRGPLWCGHRTDAR